MANRAGNTHFGRAAGSTGRVAEGDEIAVTRVATLVAGTVDVDFSDVMSSVTSVQITRHAALATAVGGQLDTPTAGIVRADDGGGAATDDISITARGPALG